MESSGRRYNALYNNPSYGTMSNLVAGEDVYKVFEANGLTLEQIANDIIYNHAPIVYSNDLPIHWGSPMAGAPDGKWVKYFYEQGAPINTLSPHGLYYVGGGDIVYSMNQRNYWANRLFLNGTPQVNIADSLPVQTVINSDNTPSIVVKNNIAVAATEKMNSCVQGQGGYYNACSGEYFNGKILESTESIKSTSTYTSSNSMYDLYWCTQLIFDSAETAGIKLKNIILSANSLYKDMVNKKSVNLTESYTDMNDIETGSVAFVSKPDINGSYTVAHVGIVSEVIVTDSGTYVTIVQSNAGSIEATYELDSQGRLAYVSESGAIYYIRGFGDLEKYANNQ